MLEGMAAASLEAIEDLTQVLFHMLSDKEDAMKVVWHELESYDSYFRIIAWDAIPFISYRLPQRRGHSPWGLSSLPKGWRGSPTTVPKMGWRPSVVIVIMYIRRDW